MKLAGHKARAIFQQQIEITNADDERAAWLEQCIEMAQCRLNIVIADQMWKRVAFADHSIKGRIKGTAKLQKADVRELDLIGHPEMCRILARFVEHGGADVGSGDGEAEPCQCDRLRARSAGSIKHRPHPAR